MSLNKSKTFLESKANSSPRELVLFCMVAGQKIEEGKFVLMLKDDKNLRDAFLRLIRRFPGIDLKYTKIEPCGTCTIQVFVPKVGVINVSRKARKGVPREQRLFVLIKHTLRQRYQGSCE